MERKMKFAFYPGCTVEQEQYAYEMSAREVFPKLDIQLIDVEGFSCCGCPLQSVSIPAWSYLSARNLALAEKIGLDIFPLCNGCNLSFRELGPYLETNHNLKERLKTLLSSEGLPFTGNVKSLKGAFTLIVSPSVTLTTVHTKSSRICGCGDCEQYIASLLFVSSGNFLKS